MDGDFGTVEVGDSHAGIQLAVHRQFRKAVAEGEGDGGVSYLVISFAVVVVRLCPHQVEGGLRGIGLGGSYRDGERCVEGGTVRVGIVGDKVHRAVIHRIVDFLTYDG